MCPRSWSLGPEGLRPLGLGSWDFGPRARHLGAQGPKTWAWRLGAVAWLGRRALGRRFPRDRSTDFEYSLHELPRTRFRALIPNPEICKCRNLLIPRSRSPENIYAAYPAELAQNPKLLPPCRSQRYQLSLSECMQVVIKRLQNAAGAAPASPLSGASDIVIRMHIDSCAVVTCSLLPPPLPPWKS